MEIPKFDKIGPMVDKLAENPWTLVAFGALAGVWLGSHGSRREDAEPRGLVMGMIGAVALKLVRDTALGQMTKIASQWLDLAPPAEAQGVSVLDADDPSSKPSFAS